MDMKKLFCLLLAVVLTLGVAGCGGNVDTGSKSVDENVTDRVTESRKTEKSSSVSTLVDGVYFVGDDIKEGKYLVTNVVAEYSTFYIVCYESRETYDAYKNENRATNGEEQNAIEKHALYDIDLFEGETGYLGLQKGNVLAVYYGSGSLDPISEDDWYLQEGATLPTGIYFQGKDIETGRYVLTSVNTEYSAQASVFESMENYVTYHQTSRFTNGEETEALEKNALDTQYVMEGDTYSVAIREGGVLIVDDGEFQVQQG